MAKKPSEYLIFLEEEEKQKIQTQIKDQKERNLKIKSRIIESILFIAYISICPVIAIILGLGGNLPLRDKIIFFIAFSGIGTLCLTLVLFGLYYAITAFLAWILGFDSVYAWKSHIEDTANLDSWIVKKFLNKD